MRFVPISFGLFLSVSPTLTGSCVQVVHMGHVGYDYPNAVLEQQRWMAKSPSKEKAA